MSKPASLRSWGPIEGILRQDHQEAVAQGRSQTGLRDVAGMLPSLRHRAVVRAYNGSPHAGGLGQAERIGEAVDFE